MTNRQSVVAYICLGSNVGDTEQYLNDALSAIAQIEGVCVEAVSPSYFTEPQGLRNQPWFANRVARLRCDAALEPYALLDALLAIESHMGRTRSDNPTERFGPRVIDLDVLLFGDATISSARLIVPHPRMHERAFVLIPLRDVIEDSCLLNGCCIDDVLSHLSYRLEGTTIWQ